MSYDIIVIGGGHAGIEAAMASSRLGSSVALVTHAISGIGQMPCNPAIGGLGKGQLVREIDVLGGWMGRAIDATGIQFRILNKRKGPAVQSPRAQADKDKYQKYMEDLITKTSGITVIEADVVELVVEKGQYEAVVLDNGDTLTSNAAILCSGTFLGGLMHTGSVKSDGGREGAPASLSLSSSLKEIGFELFRLKTGTPPRLLASSIDYDKIEAQPGDQPPQPFSFLTGDFNPKQIDCYITRSNDQTQEIISNNIETSPLFSGIISGQGPRYCPSIEDKVVRFPDRSSHNVFLEPEGIDSEEVYVNGLSTSLSSEVQQEFIRSVLGLENAQITRYGYAVEYDSIPSWQVSDNLETNLVSGLFCAGQILGTSGYEEAAAQGLIAGINAVKKLNAATPLILKRDEAYIGVLIDDLVTKEISEPYRMFTSRAEHRLSLRCDNAETRLYSIAKDLQLHNREDLALLKERAELPAKVINHIEKNNHSDSVTLKQPNVTIESLGLVKELKQAIKPKLHPRSILDSFYQAENDIKYKGYIDRQRRQLVKQQHLDYLELPESLNYMTLEALSFEAREKLQKVKPATLGQASRLDGVRQSDLAVLSVIISKAKKADLE
ncbi:tRNA uridine-5-carboxymethylaminomethyl(34) synthesis enzyme MnmG [bacterium]|jgi:tRNA uridine 5-carboxymethylaminomethyl modification enzyme|nr:tRNA uridine-5-carboxymethylaminomethyl(34) synthesis enzyme MnmG [bacterium]MBT7311619.1 tRNA uridine-5-carboxymethylaminomethyl(34) synthesis enzyme MnmG [bacterium]